MDSVFFFLVPSCFGKKVKLLMKVLPYCIVKISLNYKYLVGFIFHSAFFFFFATASSYLSYFLVSLRMSAEFSLLQHLGVSVDRGEPTSVSQSNNAVKAPQNGSFRVWAPARHPPSNKKVPPDQVSDVLDRRRRGPQRSYADPTGEVLVRNEHGAEVQYVIYNSKVPSIYGVNKQLAERQQAEKARNSASTAVPISGLEFGQDEEQQERARKHILRELQMCNLEQANRRKEEERRDRERRIAQEKAQLRFWEAEAAREEAEARLHKTWQEEGLRAAAAEAVATKKRAAAATAAAVRDVGDSAWNGADEDERRRRAAQRRTREFAEANRRQAEQQRAQRDAQEAAERARARVECAEVGQRLRAEELRETAKQRQAAAAFRLSQEADRERRLTASAAGSRRTAEPIGSLFDFAEQRESEEAQRAQRRLREDMAINARLAEEKRTQAKEEHERERQQAAQMAKANFEELQREVAKTRLRRMEEQRELQSAAKAAAAEARERQKLEELLSRSRPDDPLLFWAREDSGRSEEAKAEAQQRYYEDVRRQAERKREERVREEKAEKARECALVAYDNEVAREAASRERKESDERMAQLRRALELQIAAKKQLLQKEGRQQSLHSDLLRVPAPDVTPLYRCPVTSKLLPASAYDFGVHRGR